MAFGKFGKYYPGGPDVRPEVFDLIGQLRGDLDRVQADAAGHCVLSFAREMERCEVRTDRLHVHYIAMNLLLNAVKYSSRAGAVELSVHLLDGRPAFSVTDAGIGVPEAELGDLFSPFFRASNVGERPGTGMGLAIVKRSAQLIGAEVRVVSRRGSGSKFTIVLPGMSHASSW